MTPATHWPIKPTVLSIITKIFKSALFTEALLNFLKKPTIVYNSVYIMREGLLNET